MGSSTNYGTLKKQLQKIDAQYKKKLDKAEKKADKEYEQWWKEHHTDKNAVWDEKNDEAVHKAVMEWQQKTDTVRKKLNKDITQKQGKKEESILFIEKSTGKILQVRSTEDTHIFKWTVYNSKNGNIISTLIDSQINTMYHKGEISKIYKAGQSAIKFAGLKKPVLCTDINLEEKIEQYNKHPISKMRSYCIYEDENIHIINKQETKCIDIVFFRIPNDDIKRDLDFYHWQKISNGIYRQQPNTIIKLDLGVFLKDMWYEKGYLNKDRSLQRYPPYHITITCENFQKHLQKICEKKSSENEIVAGAQFLMTVMPKKEREKFNQLTKELGWTTPEKTKENLVKIARNEIILMPHTGVSVDKHDYTYER